MPELPGLGIGERAAIALGEALSANTLLIDDRPGRAAAHARGFETIGTLGLLDRGARRGIINLTDALARLSETNFRVRPAVIGELLRRHSGLGG